KILLAPHPIPVQRLLPQPLQHLQDTPLPNQQHHKAFTSLPGHLQPRLLQLHPYWQLLSIFHPSLLILPLASIQCLLPLCANPSTGLHSVSSTPLCQSYY
ncbi:unnamed protein product, partial [Staurois parvus]